MPRKARILVPNYPHHIVQRGHNRKAVFVGDEDYQYYLENLREWKETFDIKLYGWCLMTNHIHLIVERNNNAMDISILMKHINGRQSAYVNKLEDLCLYLEREKINASPLFVVFGKRENKCVPFVPGFILCF
jgi:putative transposase